MLALAHTFIVGNMVSQAKTDPLQDLLSDFSRFYILMILY